MRSTASTTSDSTSRPLLGSQAGELFLHFRLQAHFHGSSLGTAGNRVNLVLKQASRMQKGTKAKLEGRNWKAEMEKAKPEWEAKRGRRREVAATRDEAKRDFSLRRPTYSQERMQKKESACSIRNDGASFSAMGRGEAEGGQGKIETRN
jgi:hypothetical protein